MLRSDTSRHFPLSAHSRKRPKRRPLPEILPREEIIYDLSEEEKIGKRKIGEEISEQLKWEPAKVSVIRNIRYKYSTENDGIITAPMPPQPIPKSMATPGLLAQIAISKYADALPLYRQENIFKRFGIDISRATMAQWMIKVGELLRPIYLSLEDDVIASRYVQCDETKVQVLKEPDRRAENLSYLWVRVGFCDWGKIVLFHYSPSRSGEIASTILTGFKGYLQTDGYSAYDSAQLHLEVVRLACFAHARRKFFDIIKGSKYPKKETLAQQALEYIGHLYKIEKEIRGKSPDLRYQARQEKSVPILTELKSWLDKNFMTVPPKSPTGMAFKYLDKQWDKLERYVDNGILEIDDDIVENAIRPFALGRKNWLFSDTPKGAEASSIIYSLIETAKANHIEPFSYLTYVLEKIPLCKNTDEIALLLPQFYKKASV